MGEEIKEDLGGLKIPPAENAGAAAPVNPQSKAEEVIKRRRGRPPGSGNAGSGKANAAGIQPISQEQFRALYSPDLWTRLTAAPADAMLALTGGKHWDISEEERKSMGATSSIAAQCFAVSDPKWLALAMACMTVGTAYASRIAVAAIERKKEREKQEEKK